MELITQHLPPRQTAKVHRLPTEDKVIEGSLISRTLDDKLAIANCLTVDDKNAKPDGHINNYLYFTTEAKGKWKHGDWFFCTNGNKVYQYLPIDDTRDTSPDYQGTRKIIATTDPKLIAEGIAQPSQATIKAYCEQGGFDEVDVEYEIVNEESAHKFQPGATIINHYLKLKVDPIHNTITTHRIKDPLLKDCLNAIEFLSDEVNTNQYSELIERIKENL